MQLCRSAITHGSQEELVFAEDASYFPWKVSFLFPQTIYIQAADCQALKHLCLVDIVQQRSLANEVVVFVGPAVNSSLCLKHFAACTSLRRTWLPSG